MLKNKILILFLTVSIPLFLFTACLDEIMFTSDATNEQNLVIEAKLIRGNPSTIQVQVSQIATLEIEANAQIIPVEVKEVQLINNLGESLNLQRRDIGAYQAAIFPNSSLFSVAVGQEYQVQVLTLEEDEIASTFEPLLPVPAMESIGFEVKEGITLDRFENETIFEYLEYHLSTPLETLTHSERPFLKWNFEACYQIWDLPPPQVIPPFPPADVCYVKEKLNIEKVVIFDGRNAATNRLEQFAVLEELLNSRYAYGHYLTILQERLSKGAYEYWSQVNQITERTGSLFEVPAGEIEGNFSMLSQPDQRVYGYFYVVEQDTLRLKVTPEELDYPDFLCDEFIHTYFTAPSQCKDCLLWKNSSFTRPDYWE